MPVKGKKSTQPAAAPRPGVSMRFHFAALAILTLVVYWNSLDGGFVFDDEQIVMQNPALLNIHSFSDVLSFGIGWRQLLFFTYGLNYYLGGLNAHGYHVVNIALHLINVLLVYCIIQELAGRGHEGRFVAFAGAAVFSVHTLMSSAVSYIAGRSSVLCGIFYFLAVLFFAKALNDEELPSTRAVYIVLTIFSGIFAWQAKQESLALPGLLAALLWLRSDKKDLRYVVALAILPLVMVATMWARLQELFATVMGNKILVTAGFDPVLQPATYFRTYITSIVGYYFPRFLFPANLSADPHILPVTHWYSPEFPVSVLLLAGLAWLLVRQGTRNRLLTAGLAAILLSPLTAYAFVPLADVVLEHRAYIPGLGIALLAAALFRWIAETFSGARMAAPVVVVIVFAAMTIQRNTVFANNVTLWEDAARKSPNKTRTRFNLGAAYQNAHRPNDAIREYQRALQLKPDIHAAYSNMAAMQIDTGQLDEGEKTLVRLTQIAPEYTEGLINLSVLYIRKKDPDKAVTAADRAVAINPNSFAAHFNRAEALTQKGEFKLAIAAYERAAYLRPDLPSFQLSLGSAYVRAGDPNAAEQTFGKLTTGPLAADAYRSLAGLYSSGNNTNQAIDFLKRAIQVRPEFPFAHHDLGVIYMNKGMTDQAVEEFRTTLAQQPDNGPAVLNLSLAYQSKGDLPAARQVLETFVSQFGRSNSPYLSQVRERLSALHKGS